MAKIANGGGGVGLRIADVSGAWGSVAGRECGSFDFLEQVPDAVQRIAVAIASVVGFAGKVGGCRGFQAKRGDIRDVSEIAGLFTIAEYGGRSAFDQGFDEKRENTGIRAGRILALAVDVEESKCDGVEIEAGVKNGGVIFAHQLLHGVWGFGARQHGLDFGEHVGVAVGGRGRSVNDTANLGVGRGAEDVERAVDVDFVRRPGIVDGAGNGGNGGEVKDDVSAADGGGDGGGIADIGAVPLDLMPHVGQIFGAASQQIVDDTDLGAGFGEEGAHEG